MHKPTVSALSGVSSNRRDFVLGAAALGAAAAYAPSLLAQQHSSTLLDNKAGDCRILPVGSAYCGGVLPNEGFEVVRVLLRPWLPIEQGYAFAEAYVKSVGRPVQALCGMELRIPEVLTFEQWSSFNGPYREQLRKWGLMFGDYSGVCRSNIALELLPPVSASICAFSYTAPASGTGLSFLLTGQADIDPRGKIIAEGDIGPEGMQKRARYAIDAVGETLAKLKVAWKDATQIAVFHVHDIPGLWGPTMLGALGETARHGVLVYRGRPPFAGLEVEIEARAVNRELVIATS